jgi:hypothetical protein
VLLKKLYLIHCMKMERGRRNRRPRGHSHTNCSYNITHPPPQPSKSWTFLNKLYSFFIMTSLIALIYLMLEHHCNNCTNKCGMNNFTRSIDDITVTIFYFFFISTLTNYLAQIKYLYELVLWILDNG